jgi:hypothetical protein
MVYLVEPGTQQHRDLVNFIGIACQRANGGDSAVLGDEWWPDDSLDLKRCVFFCSAVDYLVLMLVRSSDRADIQSN